MRLAQLNFEFQILDLLRIFSQAARQHAAESPKLSLLGAAPRQPASLKV